jgi:integrase
MNPNWLRRKFRDTCELAGLNEWYAQAEDDPNPISHCYHNRRKLYRLSTHSLRHYFITKVYKSSNNMKHTQKLARHIDIKSTQTYIYTSAEELEDTMKEVFEGQSYPKPIIETKTVEN